MADQEKQASGASATTGHVPHQSRVGFCQECGRPLTAETLQRLRGGVFCSNCAAHQAPTAAWQQVHSGSYRSAAPVSPHGGGPNPVLAGVLGSIPGVGAMYNGQYAKGAMHLVVFVVLLALADNVNWVFYWLVWGWVFYQVFDAYHTARARRDHQPLPNPFGWNDLNERLTGRPTDAPAYSTSQASPRATAAGMPPEWPGYNPPPPTARETTSKAAATYAGDNPYTAPFATPDSKAPIPASEAIPASRPPTSVPYQPTYVGPSLVTPGAPLPPPQRRFPASALWLIGLGLIFLSGNLLPGFHISGQWFAPLLLAAVGVWSGFQRWGTYRDAQMTGGALPNIAGSLIAPALMFSLAILIALQFAEVLPLRRSWPVLLIISGLLSLVQRLTTPRVVPVSTQPPQEQQTAGTRAAQSTPGTGSYGL